MIAKVVGVDPVRVQLPGERTPVPVQLVADGLPELVAGDDVLVEHDRARRVLAVVARLERA